MAKCSEPEREHGCKEEEEVVVVVVAEKQRSGKQ
jgi:hypothetical protein